MPQLLSDNEIPETYKTHLPEENTNSLRETGDFMLAPFVGVKDEIKESLQRIYKVASQPVSEEPLKPLPFKDYPVEYLASLAGYVLNTPLRYAKEALDIGTTARKGSVGLQAGPRGETGEWTPEQFKVAANVTMTAGMAIGGGMPGGGTGPANIGRKDALKLLAKDFRGLKGKTNIFGRDVRSPEVYRDIVTALKNIPQKHLDPVEDIGLFTKSTRGEIGSFRGSTKTIRLKTHQPGGDPIETLGHEVIHSEQFRRAKTPITHKQVPMIEKHAEEGGRIFAEMVHKLPKGERITKRGFDEIYRQATGSLGGSPYKRKAAVSKVTDLSLTPRFQIPKEAGTVFESPVGKIRYDTSQAWEEGGKIYHQYTIQEGPARGATFSSKSQAATEIFQRAKDMVSRFLTKE